MTTQTEGVAPAERARSTEGVDPTEGAHWIEEARDGQSARDAEGARESPAVEPAPRGILAPERARAREAVVALLTRAYWMEIETVMSYLAASINLDGIRGRQIAASLADDVAEELGHARRLGERIKVLYGRGAGLA